MQQQASKDIWVERLGKPIPWGAARYFGKLQAATQQSNSQYPGQERVAQSESSPLQQWPGQTSSLGRSGGAAKRDTEEEAPRVFDVAVAALYATCQIGSKRGGPLLGK